MRNYTTTITAGKTLGEIQALLAKHGASRIMTEYEQGEPRGVTFELPTPHGPKAFTLPIDVEGMSAALEKASRSGGLKGISWAKATSMEHAERVAWRVLKDWIDAQLTLVAARMATVDQVFLPYLRVSADHTLYQAYRECEDVLALAAPVRD